MYEVLEILAAWVRQRGPKSVAGFLAFVVLPVLAALTIIWVWLIY